MADQDAAKKAAAIEACMELRTGMVVGLGTGSTVQFALEETARKVADGLQISAVPTSERTKSEAQRLGIPLTTLDVSAHIDLTIDGADEIDDRLNLIKGGGGALLREKVVAAASKRVVIIADAAKRVTQLGSTFPVPIEVLPFATGYLWPRIQVLGAQVLLRTTEKEEPFVTDNGNHVMDARFQRMKDPAWLEAKLKSMPGVMEVGIFCGLAHTAYIADGSDVQRMDRPKN